MVSTVGDGLVPSRFPRRRQCSVRAGTSPAPTPHHGQSVGDGLVPSRNARWRRGRPQGSPQGRPYGSGRDRPQGTGLSRPGTPVGVAGDHKGRPYGSGRDRPQGTGLSRPGTPVGVAGDHKGRPYGSGRDRPQGTGLSRPGAKATGRLGHGRIGSVDPHHVAHGRADFAMQNKVRDAVKRRGLAVDDHQPCAELLGQLRESGGRVDHEGGTDHDE